MIKGFKYFSIFLFVLGIALIGISAFGSLSIWYGIEIAKSSMYIFILGMFFSILENKSKTNNRKVSSAQLNIE
ncbi:hypothetical protein [Ureibacillus manganicus]|uniref:Uncharacterized protein n=1 Tax=Ureibacillus manganicus DSM 26584 TaxID=1384049 RepID=A0A0A3I0S9_9BACL|nr:hypothetical protein [Ureibacillus manganicus]KGR78289.1 hypothetical protein CD29_11235 [Ureibacillus manganicus DSM 26584]